MSQQDKDEKIALQQMVIDSLTALVLCQEKVQIKHELFK